MPVTSLNAFHITPGHITIDHADLQTDESSTSQRERENLRRNSAARHSQSSPVLSPADMKKSSSTMFNDFQRVQLHSNASHLTDESREVCKEVRQAVRLRDEYLGPLQSHYYPVMPLNDPRSLDVEQHEFGSKSKHSFRCEDGVFYAWEGDESDKLKEFICEKSMTDYYKDLAWLMKLTTSGPAKTFCYNRLKILESRFQLHIFLNEANETNAQKNASHRDFYNVRKIDNHVHHSACMNQKHLLRFIKKRLKHEGHRHVMEDDKSGKPRTLTEVFNELNLTAYDLSLDKLDMHGHRDTRNRFDRFNKKYNPIGCSNLRQLFLKTDNYMGGEFLAKITQEVISDLEENKYQFAEYRLSIYGKHPGEWDKLAHWVCKYKLHSSNIRWMIQIPRIYNVYKKKGLINNFGEMINNIFTALFEVTVDPSSHPELHLFLQHVVAVDSVDDESKRETRKDRRYPVPDKWDRRSNPPYNYWSYYIWANLTVLNKLRIRKGYNTFAFRPHAGEAGDIQHLAVTFLLANGINHGINLEQAPVLQYLYYITQIGISMSPLSNNLLFLDYDKNPFPRFFRRGLNVTLSTDDPLMIHYTKEPLVEEYSVAAQVWRLSSTDMCEIARNSVLQSGFEYRLKKHWIGDRFEEHGVAGNDIEKTNVPDLRIQYRAEVLSEELAILSGGYDKQSTHLFPIQCGIPGNPGTTPQEHMDNDWPPARYEPREYEVLSPTRSERERRNSSDSSEMKQTKQQKQPKLNIMHILLVGAFAFMAGISVSKLKRS